MKSKKPHVQAVDDGVGIVLSSRKRNTKNVMAIVGTLIAFFHFSGYGNIKLPGDSTVIALIAGTCITLFVGLIYKTLESLGALDGFASEQSYDCPLCKIAQASPDKTPQLVLCDKEFAKARVNGFFVRWEGKSAMVTVTENMEIFSGSLHTVLASETHDEFLLITADDMTEDEISQVTKGAKMISGNISNERSA